jgi:hypothetical protein
MNNPHKHTRALVNIIMASALVAALGLIIIVLFQSSAKGEPMRASSTVYPQAIKDPPRHYRRYKYRTSYRRSRSRIAAVPREAAAVRGPASRAEIPSSGAHQPSQPPTTVAGQMLLMGHWSAPYFFEPYYGHHPRAEAEPEEFTGPLMLERGEPEPEPSNLHLVALGAIAAAVSALLIYAATGGQHERPAPQWAPWSDA